MEYEGPIHQSMEDKMREFVCSIPVSIVAKTNLTENRVKLVFINDRGNVTLDMNMFKTNDDFMENFEVGRKYRVVVEFDVE